MKLFDEWGNFWGDFTPAASDSWVGLVIGLFMFSVGIFVFLIYYFFKSIARGIEELEKEDGEKNLKPFIFPGIVCLILLVALLVNGVTSISFKSNIENYLDFSAEFVEETEDLGPHVILYIENTSSEAVSFEDIEYNPFCGGVYIDRLMPGEVHESWCWNENTIYTDSYCANFKLGGSSITKCTEVN